MVALSYRDRLAREFEDRKLRNPNYSLRAFARDLRISPTTLSCVLSNERHLSRQSAARVCDSLKWGTDALTEILDEIGAESAVPIDSRQQRKVLSNISHWYFFAVLKLAELETNQADPKWISERLNITQDEAGAALKGLLANDLIQLENGRMTRSGESVFMQDLPGPEMLNCFEEFTQIAQDAFARSPEKGYRFMAAMLIDPRHLQRSKKALWRFHNRMKTTLRGKSPSEVYALNVNVFPLKGRAK